VERGLLLLAVVLVLASLISYFYYLRVAWYMWFRDPAAGRTAERTVMEPAMTVALVVAAVGTVLLGVFPGVLLELAERGAAGLMQVPGSFIGMAR
jgi:NADH-quinone oxidoreductase subunit N